MVVVVVEVVAELSAAAIAKVIELSRIGYDQVSDYNLAFLQARHSMSLNNARDRLKMKSCCSFHVNEQRKCQKKKTKLPILQRCC